MDWETQPVGSALAEPGQPYWGRRVHGEDWTSDCWVQNDTAEVPGEGFEPSISACPRFEARRASRTC